VVAVDRSPSPITGLPLDLPFASTEVCVNPAFMEAHQAADGLFLYVSCFDTGEIYVVDAQQNRVRDVIEVGRGPAGIVFDQSGRNPNLGYVLGFGANNLSVVDVAPGSPTRHRVIQRIGFPSQTPRDFQP
jgi:YVTN family beta-propeller protein